MHPIGLECMPTFIQPIRDLADVSLVGHDHQKIEVAIRSGMPFGGGAKENDARGLGQAHYLLHNLPYRTLYIGSLHA